MALPKLTTPEYELDVPSTGEKLNSDLFLLKNKKF